MIMIGTLVSILLAAFFWFKPIEGDFNPTFLAALMSGCALVFLLIMPISLMLSWSPLQNAEQNSMPRVMQMFKKDMWQSLFGIWLSIFILISFAAAFDLIYSHQLKINFLLSGWVILFGLAIDALRGFSIRVMRFLNPYSAVEIFSKEAKKSIQNDKELDLCHWLDALSEVAIKSIQRHSSSVTNLALSEQQNLARLFLEASKSIGHQDQDKQIKELGITDKVSYTMFYLYQRLDVVFEKALRSHFEMTCSHIATLLGKITIDAAKYDVSMASAPLRFLGKCAKRAQEEGFEETAVTASCTFSEVAKALLTEIDIAYNEIKDPFLSIINGMEILAKGSFKRDKSININLLVFPFKELKSLFQADKVKEHQDTPVIVQNIDRVLGEFEALQMVMSTLPPLPANLEKINS